MPGPWDKDKESWRPSERDWALARELASAQEEDHDAVASALLALVTSDGSGCVESIALEQKSHQFLSRYRKSAGQLIEHPRPASARG